jgi:hypothetical protein
MTRRLAFVIGLLTVLGESYSLPKHFGKKKLQQPQYFPSDFRRLFLRLGGRKVEIIDAVPQEKLSVRAARHLWALPLPPFHADDGSLTGLSPVRTGTRRPCRPGNF